MTSGTSTGRKLAEFGGRGFERGFEGDRGFGGDGSAAAAAAAAAASGGGFCMCFLPGSHHSTCVFAGSCITLLQSSRESNKLDI